MPNPPLRINIRTTDGLSGWTGPMPDDRVLITLTDGRTFVVDGDRLEPRPDGTYVIAMTDAERSPLSSRAP
jgi:hypothetical protein